MKNRSYSAIAFLLLSPVILAACLLFGSAGPGLPDMASAAGRSIFNLRLHRVIEGFMVGAALAGAGAVFQALLRNPLAEPYILGVSSGAGLGAAAAILAGVSLLGAFTLPVTAFVAGGLTLALVFLIARGGRGMPSIYSLILSGVIVSAVASSLLMFLVAISPIEGMHSIMWWMLGNLQPASRELLVASSIPIAAGLLLISAMAPELNALTLGREMAHSVGIRTGAAVFAGLCLATLVTASAVATAGLIGFVGLIVPHVMRAVVGPDHRRLIPACALGGGVFLAVCDAVARTIMAPEELPVGVVTALLGGPFFLIILHKRRKQGWVE